MTERNFRCTVGVLLDAAASIIKACDDHPELASTLKAGLLTETTGLRDDVRDMLASQKHKGADLGDLTIEQNDAITTMRTEVAAARKAARNAFKGQKVKLHDDYQIGISTKLTKLADEIATARIILASCRRTADADALADWGWHTADADALETAINGADDADKAQNTAKSDPVDATTALNEKANNLYTNIRKIQTATDIKCPAADPANRGIRKDFLLGTFPPPEKKPKSSASSMSSSSSSSWR